MKNPHAFGEDHDDDAVMRRHFRETEAAAGRALQSGRNLLPLVRVSHTQFSRNREGGKLVFTAEASSLPRELFQRVYGDACDAGFTIVGERHDVTYVLADTHFDNEGDLTHWTLVPSPESEHQVPSCKHTQVVIFND